MLNYNDHRIAVITSKDGHGISAADTNVNKTEHPDLVGSHLNDPRSARPPNALGLCRLLRRLTHIVLHSCVRRMTTDNGAAGGQDPDGI